MKKGCLITLFTLAMIACFSGFKPTEALADSDTGEIVANGSGKFGIGFHNAFPLSGISAKYWTSKGIGLQGFLMRVGFSLPIEDLSGSLTTVGGRFLYTVHTKPRVKFYLGAGTHYTDMEVSEGEYEDANSRGIGLEGVGGVEYSFSDLPNLGFAFEFGMGFLSLGTEDDDDLNLHFTTSGTVGIHYYF